jgi:hypothetical protein
MASLAGQRMMPAVLTGGNAGIRPLRFIRSVA